MIFPMCIILDTSDDTRVHSYLNLVLLVLDWDTFTDYRYRLVYIYYYCVYWVFATHIVSDSSFKLPSRMP